MVNTGLHIVSYSSGKDFHSGLYFMVTSCLDSCSLTLSHTYRECLIGRKFVLIELERLYAVFCFLVFLLLVVGHAPVFLQVLGMW